MSPKDPTGKREREGEGVYCGVACNNTGLFDCFVSDLNKNSPTLLKRSTWSRSVTASCLASSTASFTPSAVLRSTATQRNTSCDIPEPCSSSFKYLQQRLGASHQQEDRTRLHRTARLAKTRKTCVLLQLHTSTFLPDVHLLHEPLPAQVLWRQRWWHKCTCLVSSGLKTRCLASQGWQ